MIKSFFKNFLECPISYFNLRLRGFREGIEFWLNANVVPTHIMFMKFRNIDSERIFSENVFKYAQMQYQSYSMYKSDNRN